MSRHEPRQQLAREYGATDIVEERGDDGVARIKELTGGLGAHSVIEGVGTQESMLQAIGSTRPGGHVGFVGVAHGAELPVEGLFWSFVHVHGGPAPVRRFLPELIELIWNRQIDPGKVFDLSLPLEEAAEGYRAIGRGGSSPPSDTPPEQQACTLTHPARPRRRVRMLTACSRKPPRQRCRRPGSGGHRVGRLPIQAGQDMGVDVHGHRDGRMPQAPLMTLAGTPAARAALA
jgi:hypothetical protein